ncbi:hypothetical protein OPQ81_010291 [Rhizoctonia solani]|nr:hypothetical protein OPQ81_010291 [Rhizoctonia solani]
MSEYLSRLPGSSDAEFWCKGSTFGIHVNDANLKMSYLATVTETMFPGGSGTDGRHVERGKLYYDSSLPYPIPPGVANATMVKDAMDDSGRHRLYIIFQNGSLRDPEPTNTFAIFEFGDEPHPDVFILTSGLGQWTPSAS